MENKIFKSFIFSWRCDNTYHIRTCMVDVGVLFNHLIKDNHEWIVRIFHKLASINLKFIEPWLITIFFL